MLHQAAIQPEVFLGQEAEVPVVDVEREVVAVAVECNDLALGVGCHPLKEDTFVVLHGFGPLLLCLSGELHLVEPNHKWLKLTRPVCRITSNFPAFTNACTLIFVSLKLLLTLKGTFRCL